MAIRNFSRITEFILLGITIDPKLNTTLFVLFLLIYLITMVGSIWVITVILVSAQFHSPKYFFFS